MAKIVLIDDSKLMRHLLQHMLEKAGYAVDIWEEVTSSEIPKQLGASNPDLIITDYMMPGTDGLTVVRMLRKTQPQLPIIVITSTRDPSVVDALNRQEVNCILHKPLQEEVVLAAVTSML